MDRKKNVMRRLIGSREKEKRDGKELFHIALLYENGWGVRKDLYMAEKYILKSSGMIMNTHLFKFLLVTSLEWDMAFVITLSVNHFKCLLKTDEHSTVGGQCHLKKLQKSM
jgi:hypothetical protein